MRWFLTGSLVLAIDGTDLVPNDLDVTPALDEENLRRLAYVLQSIEAIPYTPTWTNGWSVEQCRSWRPLPATEQNLDHLFVTRLGMLDVPPRLCGTYEHLIPGATILDIADVPVSVCVPDQVLSRLEGRTRTKDLERAAAYDALRAQPPEDRHPTGLDDLVRRLP